MREPYDIHAALDAAAIKWLAAIRQHAETPVYLTGADVAKELGITRAAVSHAASRGRLTHSARTQSGTPLFTMEDVDGYRTGK